MSEAHRIIEVRVSTVSSEPKTGVVRVSTSEAEIEFEITEDLAQRLCADLDHFLTR